MWTYSSNIMGPYGLWWYEENNIPYTEKDIDSKIFGKQTYKQYEQWYGGRIDCYCSNTSDVDYSPYNQELYLPIMKGSSLRKLDDFLKDYSSDFFNKDLLKTFETETGFTLEIFPDIYTHK